MMSLCCDARNELSHAGRVVVRERLSSSIAHEVAQPISAAVLTNAETALRWLSAQQPDLAEARLALGRVIRDANRASEVVSAIRALHKREPLRREGLQINRAVLAVLHLTKDEVRKNGVSVRTYLAKSLQPIQGDRIQLQQVLLNLISNAVDAMRASRQGSRELLISTGRAGSHGVLVRVRDSGPGLAPANLECVFQAFYTTKQSGLGMGLSCWTRSGRRSGAAKPYSMSRRRSRHQRDYREGAPRPHDEKNAGSLVCRPCEGGCKTPPRALVVETNR
jgi:C4-dicarboxylate-specific signal transduction histidine kinase